MENARMLTKTGLRQSQIVERTRFRNTVSIEELATEFGVSMQTIRRDINALCDANILRRRHGGAELMEHPVNTAYDARRALNTGAKRAIASAVCEMIEDGATIFISIGTTPAIVAHELHALKNLTVVTNNLNAAMALTAERSNRIIIPGGEIRLPDRDLLSDEASAVFTRYRADFGIYGVGGIDADGSLLDFHRAEVRAREAIRENARCSVLVADSSKFGRPAPALGGMIDDADHVVIEARPEADYAHILERLGERLRITEEIVT
ncbi:DeoR/GlpR transcriptional regulator [Pikeienuella piscinae]|uniref:DeoR/GlpR transcriptional regulator n=2 Tax=Pikeienuella piscinae TaxID=2748098 RepID=A0A7M3T7E9_9RHOB|nr:DeoR/GlpR transcriptional regulator [Pikeienuella piscinae]